MRFTDEELDEIYAEAMSRKIFYDDLKDDPFVVRRHIARRFVEVIEAKIREKMERGGT